jgi:hypothetical protein
MQSSIPSSDLGDVCGDAGTTRVMRLRWYHAVIALGLTAAVGGALLRDTAGPWYYLALVASLVLLGLGYHGHDRDKDRPSTRLPTSPAMGLLYGAVVALTIGVILSLASVVAAGTAIAVAGLLIGCAAIAGLADSLEPPVAEPTRRALKVALPLSAAFFVALGAIAIAMEA